MNRFHIIKKASPVNYALESSRTLDNGVVLKLIHCGAVSYTHLCHYCLPW